ncbi:hypothetical protein RGQ29_032457 [Quercus rubra]|uniref:Uncharacterized protein n=1 Tax=Quercus rubra TaxID=3512 RepID=A0AAN7I6D2_QUERU|nr:hypothetical protein RGQ29_032457 [Quercus rubra]
MAWQALCSRIKLSGMLPISVVSSVAWMQFESLCCIPTSKALVPLVDLLPVDASHKASTGPRSHPHVPRVPHGLYFADVDHRHCSAPRDRCAHSCPSLPSGKLRPLGDAGIDNECYLVDPASSHMLVSKIKPCMCKYELIQTMKLHMANLV